MPTWWAGWRAWRRAADEIRDTLRVGRLPQAHWEPVDIDEMRRVVAEELARALAGRLVAGSAMAPPVEDIEGKYGAKLDRMLGGLGDWRLCHHPIAGAEKHRLLGRRVHSGIDAAGNVGGGQTG